MLFGSPLSALPENLESASSTAHLLLSVQRPLCAHWVFIAMRRGGPDYPHLACEELSSGRLSLAQECRVAKPGLKPRIPHTKCGTPFTSPQLHPRDSHPGCSFGALLGSSASGIPFLPRPSGHQFSNLYLLQNCLGNIFKAK